MESDEGDDVKLTKDRALLTTAALWCGLIAVVIFTTVAVRCAAADTVTPAATTAPSGVLLSGPIITSPSGQFSLVMQPDGNFVLYSRGSALHTLYIGCLASLRLSPEGAMSHGAMFGGDPAFTSQMSVPGCQGLRFEATNASSANLECADGSVGYSTHFPGYPGATRTWGGVIRPGHSVSSTQYLASPNGLFELRVRANPMQAMTHYDYPDRYDVNWGWQFPTYPGPLGASSAYLVMQADGNLVLYGTAGVVWSTQTFVPGSIAALQNDGNLLIYPPTGPALWSACSTLYAHS